MESSRAVKNMQPQQSAQASDETIPVQVSLDVRACPQCGTGNPATNYFCPHCGKKFKNPSPSTSVWGQIKVYAFSILVPPFGIIPAVKYLLQAEKKSKIIGMVIIVLTLISSAVTIIYTMQFINSFNAELTKQLGPLHNLGY